LKPLGVESVVHEGCGAAGAAGDDSASEALLRRSEDSSLMAVSRGGGEDEGKTVMAVDLGHHRRGDSIFMLSRRGGE
jgi:hypothetical protein